MARNTRPTTRKPWRIFYAGLTLGLLGGITYFAPARWLAHAVESASQGQVLLRDADGSLWQGSAQLVLSAGPGSQSHTALPGRLQWQLQTVWPGLQLTLRDSCCLGQPWVWRISPDWGKLHIQVSDLVAQQPSRWPADILTGLGAPWNTLQLQGTLALSTEKLALTLDMHSWQMSGRMQLDALQITTSLTTIKPMGSYRVKMDAAAENAIALSTLEGSLRMTGEGRLHNGRLIFDGEASAAPEQTQALANLLNIMGRRNGSTTTIKIR